MGVDYGTIHFLKYSLIHETFRTLQQCFVKRVNGGLVFSTIFFWKEPVNISFEKLNGLFISNSNSLFDVQLACGGHGPVRGELPAPRCAQDVVLRATPVRIQTRENCRGGLSEHGAGVRKYAASQGLHYLTSPPGGARSPGRCTDHADQTRRRFRIFQCWGSGSGSCMFFGLLDLLVRGTNPDPDPSIIKQKQ